MEKSSINYRDFYNLERVEPEEKKKKGSFIKKLGIGVLVVGAGCLGYSFGKKHSRETALGIVDELANLGGNEENKKILYKAWNYSVSTYFDKKYSRKGSK